MANIDLFSYFPGLEVTAEEVMRAELLAYQVLSAKYPDIDLREGTAIRDMVLRPNATLLALLNKALIFYFEQNTVTGITNDTPTVFVDKLMSNWFISRKEGNNSVINIRLFFSKSKNVTIYTDVYFSPDGILKFYPEVSQVFSSSNLTYDSSSNQYYVDIDVIAEKAGSAYDISSGSLLYFTNFDPYFMHGEINYLKSTSVDVESNLDFITRTKSAISTRNLINVPSIVNNLLDTFSYIDDIIIRGFGDVGMIRDKIKVLSEVGSTNIWLHNGGMVDVYCKTPVDSNILQFELDEEGKVEISGAIYQVERSAISGGDEVDTLPPKIQSVTELWWSGGFLIVTVPSNGYLQGDTITISNCITEALNGVYVIDTLVDENIFAVILVTDPGTIELGTDTTCTLDSDFSITYTFLTVQEVISITSENGVATAIVAEHGLEVGERVLVEGAGIPTSDYSGIRTVTSVIDDNTFTYMVDELIVSPAEGTEITVSYPSRSSDYGFTDRQVMTLDFGLHNAGKKVSLVLHYFSTLDSIDSYLVDKSNKVLCADILARGFNLSFLDITITSYTGFSPDSELCTSVIKDYLNTIGPGESFIMSDLLSLLYSKGVTTIKTPLEVTYNKYWKDCLGNTTGTITDILSPDDPLNIFMLNSVTTNFEIV